MSAPPGAAPAPEAREKKKKGSQDNSWNQEQAGDSKWWLSDGEDESDEGESAADLMRLSQSY